MLASELGDALLVLAQRVRDLRPDHRDPERFHIEKDQIGKELRRLANDEQGRRRA